MLILNHFSPGFIQIGLSSVAFNSRKTRVVQRSIHLRSFLQLQENGWFDCQQLVSFLQYLGDLRVVNCGKSVHSAFVKTGLDQVVFVQNNLINFYSVCGDLVNARLMFDEMREPNLVSWTSMISSYVHGGQDDLGLKMFASMCRSGWLPNEFGFSVALKACRVLHNFVMGRIVHGQIVKSGFEFSSFCCTSILGFYVDSGSIENAQKFFDGIPLWGRMEASWNALLDGYVQASNGEGAIEFLYQMMYANISPNCFTYSILIKLCASMLNFEFGRSIHGLLVKAGFENNVIVGGALVDAYAKVGHLDDACQLFQTLKEKDNMAWCALLAGYHQIGDDKNGLTYFLEFLSQGNKPDSFTFATVFSLCSNLETLDVGSQVHCSFIKYGYILDSFLGSALLDMYGSCGMISYSYKCFLEVECKNEVCFSTMIHNLIFTSNEEMAIELFLEMGKLDGLIPSHSTLSFIVRACAHCYMLKEGRTLHSHIIKTLSDFNSRLCLDNALLEMYVKCGVVDKAQIVFKDMLVRNEFSWTTIISGFYESGQFKEALRLFHDMLQSSESTNPSQFTLVTVLQTCAKLGLLAEGKQIHSCVMKLGFEAHSYIGSALINMYAMSKHEINSAYTVFSSLNEKDVVSWSAMISGWAQNGNDHEALKLFKEFQNAPNFVADESILSICLSSCAGSAALDMGKGFHTCIIRTGFESYIHVASSLIDMYGKCGSITDAHKLFDEVKDHNIVSWTAMMSGFAHHGHGKAALELFREMKEAGLEPDGVTFVGVLTACSHAGLVKEGLQYFELLRSEYSPEITINHYACMVDLLSRSEQMDEAQALISEAPFQSKSLLWKTLLGACSRNGNIELAHRIAQILVEVEPDEPSTYFILSNIYASASMWGNFVEARNKMGEEYVKKLPGCSWVQVAS